MRLAGALVGHEAGQAERPSYVVVAVSPCGGGTVQSGVASDVDDVVVLEDAVVFEVVPVTVHPIWVLKHVVEQVWVAVAFSEAVVVLQSTRQSLAVCDWVQEDSDEVDDDCVDDDAVVD